VIKTNFLRFLRNEKKESVRRMNSPTMKDILEGAERAHERVAKWPQWKRDISGVKDYRLDHIVGRIIEDVEKSKALELESLAKNGFVSKEYLLKQFGEL
jgi:chromatin segregation and condensation protein Rec8/ScpA/Scc1 (kleisin family)